MHWGINYRLVPCGASNLAASVCKYHFQPWSQGGGGGGGEEGQGMPRL